eukprot:763381-Hanusia_phi.AAC.3
MLRRTPQRQAESSASRRAAGGKFWVSVQTHGRVRLLAICQRTEASFRPAPGGIGESRSRDLLCEVILAQQPARRGRERLRPTRPSMPKAEGGTICPSVRGEHTHGK